MNYPAASNGVSTGIFLSPQGAGNSPLVCLRRIKIMKIPMTQIQNSKQRSVNICANWQN